MKGKKLVAATVAVTLLTIADPSAAAESAFRKNFIKSYENNNFPALEFLIKGNKAAIPGEIKTLFEEAKAKASFPERMHTLDIAITMATMYRDWHNDGAPLAELEAYQRAEIKKEEDRKAELEKWKKYESTLGNFALVGKVKEAEARGLSPVLFPHWVHRFYYDCKACHQESFPMKQGATAITHAEMDKGRLCGACHEGKAAFSTADKESCERCHNIGKPAEERVTKFKKADQNKIAEAAGRVGASFKPDATGKFPLDKFYGMDWTALAKNGHATVRTASKDGEKDTIVFYDSPVTYLKGAYFDHRQHSGANCSACHPEPYKDALTNSGLKMSEMAEGKGCGSCHGKVAFKLADCNRCHARQPGEIPGALTRTKQGQ